MEKIKFLTDTASDLPGDYETKYGIDFEMIPIAITIDGQDYEDDQNSNFKAFYKALRQAENLPQTAQINTYTFLQYYKKAYEEGYTHIIGMFLPSFASGTYQNALSAIALFEEECPEAKVEFFIPDTKTYSLGYGLGLVEAARAVKAGADFEQAKETVTKWLERIEIYFCMYSLEYARKSGRLSKTMAVVGELLGIKPIMCVKDGELSIYKKVRGTKGIVRELNKIVQDRMDTEQPFAVLKSEIEEEADGLYEDIKAHCNHEGYGPLYSGPAVTINSGPEIIGVGFLK